MTFNRHVLAAPRPAVRGAPRRLLGLLLDKDGTLFDAEATWRGWAAAFVAAEAGGDAAVATALADGLGFDLAAGRFRPESPVLTQPTERVAARLEARLARLRPGTAAAPLVARMEALAEGTAQVEAAPLRPLIARLAGQGLALGLATNDTEASARAHLEAAGIAEAFPFVAGCDSGHGTKPGPGPLLAFARAAGLAPGDCAMVGDSLHDLAAARAAGMAAVAVLTGVGEPAALAARADAVLGSVAELPAWVASWRRGAA